MFNFFKSKNHDTVTHSTLSSLRGAERRDNLPPPNQPRTNNLEQITLRLSGLHCTSCAVNIDLALEDLPSVKAKTNYAKSETKITYDPAQVTLDEIHFVIRDLGYSID